MNDFTAIPILDLSLAESPQTKPQFLSELQHALVWVGFFYLKNHSVPEDIQQHVKQQSVAFFNLPMAKKLEIDEVHSKHFFGYSKMDSELTAGGTDYSEAFYTGSDVPPPGPDQPLYCNLEGPSQWPEENEVPGFRHALERYRSEVQQLSIHLARLIAEALGLEPASMTRLLGDSPQNRLSLRSYLPPPHGRNGRVCQGIGAHKDETLLTYLLQPDGYNCLEVQNRLGAWIPVPPIPGTLVVNLGWIFEVVTRGVCPATTHRVMLRPEAFTDQSGMPLGPRQSVAFFQSVDIRLKVADLPLDIPPHIVDLVRGQVVISDAEKQSSGMVDNSVGDLMFVAHLHSYRELARKWYPDTLQMLKEKEAAKMLH